MDWTDCKHKWGEWQYTATWGDEFHWRICSKCGANQEGEVKTVATRKITKPHPNWKKGK